MTALATNGASGIHDFEVAFHGKTSEDVGAVLETGEFGMSRETGEGIFRALRAGRKKGVGYGRALGEAILRGPLSVPPPLPLRRGGEGGRPAHRPRRARDRHARPASRAWTARSSARCRSATSRRSGSVIAELGDGGVWINAGSAVIMPEVFLKALSMARNLGHDVRDFTTVDLDMIRHYRPNENVLKRPVLSGGASYAITGHHEILLPLLGAGARCLRAGRTGER